MASSSSRRVPPAFDMVKDTLVLVTHGSEGAGSGFLAHSEGKIWLFTNEHVLRMGKPLTCTLTTGQELQLKEDSVVDIATNRDLIRLPVAEDLPALDWREDLPAIGEEIFVYGNSDGGGVITQLKGRVLGFASDILEVNAKFVGGNSGCPIVDKSGAVVAVATFAQKREEPANWVKEGTRFNRVRRFGVRNENIQWQSVAWKAYAEEAQKLQDIQDYVQWFMNVPMTRWLKDSGSVTKTDIELFKDKNISFRMRNVLKSLVQQDLKFVKATQNLEKSEERRRTMAPGSLGYPTDRDLEREKRQIVKEDKARIKLHLKGLIAAQTAFTQTKWLIQRLRLDAQDAAKQLGDVLTVYKDLVQKEYPDIQ